MSNQWDKIAEWLYSKRHWRKYALAYLYACALFWIVDGLFGITAPPNSEIVLVGGGMVVATLVFHLAMVLYG